MVPQQPTFRLVTVRGFCACRTREHNERQFTSPTAEALAPSLRRSSHKRGLPCHGSRYREGLSYGSILVLDSDRGQGEQCATKLPIFVAPRMGFARAPFENTNHPKPAN